MKNVIVSFRSRANIWKGRYGDLHLVASRKGLMTCSIAAGNKQASHDQIPPVLSLLQIPQHTKQDQRTTADGVVNGRALNTGDDEVADGLALSPLQDLWAKPIVSETLRRIHKSIPRKLELNVDSLHSRFLSRRRGCRDFVRMVLHGQTSKPGLQFAL